MTSDQVAIADDGPFLRATVRLPGCTPRLDNVPALIRWRPAQGSG